MRALIWKEFRLCWPILLVGCVLLVAPYSILLGDSPGRNHESYVVDITFAAALASMAVAMLTVTLMSGYAIAGERNDRSVEFLAYLPVSRWSNMISKLVWPLVMALFVIGVNATVVYGILVRTSSGAAYQFTWAAHQLNRDFITSLVFMWSLGFSIAWLGSAVLRSPTFAVAGGMLGTLLTALAVHKVVYSLLAPQVRAGEFDPRLAYVSVAIILASASFVAGCYLYLRRVEP